MSKRLAVQVVTADMQGACAFIRSRACGGLSEMPSLLKRKLARAKLSRSCTTPALVGSSIWSFAQEYRPWTLALFVASATSASLGGCGSLGCPRGHYRPWQVVGGGSPQPGHARGADMRCGLAMADSVGFVLAPGAVLGVISQEI